MTTGTTGTDWETSTGPGGIPSDGPQGATPAKAVSPRVVLVHGWGVIRMTLVNSARQGRLPGLKRLRDMLAAQLDECDSNRDFAALSTRLIDVLAQIDELEQAAGKKPAARKETGLDEFTRRLKERQQAQRRDAAKGSRRAGSSR